MKSPNLSKSEVLISLFKSVFFSPIIILFFNIHIKGAPMFLKCDPYRVWCSIFYSKFVNCILLRSLFVFVKGRGTCGSGERNVKIWIDFRKSSRCSLTSPLSQEREKSSRFVFTMCGEPWLKNVLFCYIIVFNWQTYLQFLLAEIYICRFSSASSETCLSQIF
jgi:hypothetical protein